MFVGIWNCQVEKNPHFLLIYLHMKTVRKNGKHGDWVDDDDLDDSVPVGDAGVDAGGVGHCLQSVQGNSCQTQGGNVNRQSLKKSNM